MSGEGSSRKGGRRAREKHPLERGDNQRSAERLAKRSSLSEEEWHVSANDAARKRDRLCLLLHMLFTRKPIRIVEALPQDYDIDRHGQVQIIRRDQILGALKKHWDVKKAFNTIVNAESFRDLPMKHDSSSELINMEWPDRADMMDVTDAELKSTDKKKIDYQDPAVAAQQYALWELGCFTSDESEEESEEESKEKSKEESEEESDDSDATFRTPERTGQRKVQQKGKKKTPSQGKTKIPPAPTKTPKRGHGKEAVSDSDELDIEASEEPLSRNPNQNASPPSPSPEPPMSSREAELLAANKKLQKEMEEMRQGMFGKDGGGRSVAVPRRAAAPRQVAVPRAPAQGAPRQAAAQRTRDVTPFKKRVSPRFQLGMKRSKTIGGTTAMKSTRVPGGPAKKPRK